MHIYIYISLLARPRTRTSWPMRSETAGAAGRQGFGSAAWSCPEASDAASAGSWEGVCMHREREK